jgi:hypothetical protein
MVGVKAPIIEISSNTLLTLAASVLNLCSLYFRPPNTIANPGSKSIVARREPGK